MEDIVYKLTSEGESWAMESNSKYNLTYKIGSITKCLENTLGIFCFTSLEFLYNSLSILGSFFPEYFIIYKVKGINRIGPPRAIGGCSEKELDLFYDKKIFSPHIIPYGTVCYEAVEVLERIN